MYFKVVTALIIFLNTSLVFATCDSHHQIFLVHGIASKTERTFGHMEEALKAQFNRDDLSCHKINMFNYDTGNDEKSAKDFALDFHKFVKVKVQNKNDKISIVAHSQGGLVSLIWMVRSYQQDKEFSPSFMNQIESYTTLSTPFWGAGIASVGNFIRAPYYLPFGKKELREMSYGSDTISMLFNFFTDASNAENEDKIRKEVRVLNVAGVLGAIKHLHRFRVRTRRLENDLVVPVSSARLGFLVAKDQRTSYKSNDEWGLNAFSQKEFGDLHVVRAAHFRAPYFNLRGTAKIPKKCIKDFNCNHPTLKAVYRNITGQKQSLDRELALKTTSFRININVNLPKEWQENHSQDEIFVRFLRNKNDIVRTSKRSGRLSKVSDNMVQARFHYFGSLREKPEHKGAKATWYPSQKYIKIKLEAPGLKSRILKVLVKQTFTSFVTVNMSLKE